MPTIRKLQLLLLEKKNLQTNIHRTEFLVKHLKDPGNGSSISKYAISIILQIPSIIML